MDELVRWILPFLLRCRHCRHQPTDQHDQQQRTRSYSEHALSVVLVRLRLGAAAVLLLLLYGEKRKFEFVSVCSQQRSTVSF